MTEPLTSEEIGELESVARDLRAAARYGEMSESLTEWADRIDAALPRILSSLKRANADLTHDYEWVLGNINGIEADDMANSRPSLSSKDKNDDR